MTSKVIDMDDVATQPEPIISQSIPNDNYKVVTKITDNIYLGPKLSMIDEKEFGQLNIDIIINCAREVVSSVPNRVAHLDRVYPPDNIYKVVKFPIVDGDPISFIENMDRAEEKIHTYVSRNKKIYIHCECGISRAPAILMYYLMVHSNYDYYDASDFITNARPAVNIDSEFEQILLAINDDQ